MATEIFLENRELFEKRSGCWELALAVDRLEPPLRELVSDARAIRLAPSAQGGSFPGSEDWILEHSLIMRLCVEALDEHVGKDLPVALGKPGEPGSADAINSVCADILENCRELVDAEREIVQTRLHPDFVVTQRALSGYSLALLDQFAAMVAGFRRIVETGTAGEIEFTIAFHAERIENLPMPVPLARSSIWDDLNLVDWKGMLLLLALVAVGTTCWWIALPILVLWLAYKSLRNT
ncbi:MAG: hypothetical protein ACOYM3_04565 [Terrimicrobiaceae bacterium]